MTNKDDGVFRMRVRVKAGSQSFAAPPVTSAIDANPEPSTAGGKPKSLIEALKRTAAPATPRSRNPAPPKAAAKRQAKKKLAAKKAPEPQLDEQVEPAQADSNDGALTVHKAAPVAVAAEETPRDVISTRSKSSGHITARLKHLERLKAATTSLERVTSGKIEEATVEIIHHDKPRPADTLAD